MRKKLLIVLMFLISCFTLVFGLSACVTSGDNSNSNNSQQGTTQNPDNQPNSSRVELTSTQIYQKVNPSVAFVLISQSSKLVSGSGFFIDKNGTLVTNYHVIEDGITGVLQLYNGETATIQTVLGYNETLDIAILSTSAKYTTPATLGNSSGVQVGDTVYAIGYPEAFEVGFSSSTFTTGMVSMNRSIGGYTYIQSTVDITHGNSGGALINTYGEVIGITTAGLNIGNVDYMNLSIPIQRIDTVSRNVNESLEIVTKRHYPVYVTYQTDNTVYQKQTLKYEGVATKPINPTKTGYTFENWYENKDCTKLFDFNKKIIANTTVYAKFNIKSYNVTYNLVSGSWNGSTPQSTYTLSDCNKALPSPIRSGYLFEGWLDSVGNYIDNFPASNSVKDLTLTASWVVGTEGLKFVQNQVTEYVGTEIDIVIPSTYRKVKITQLKPTVFQNNTIIKSVTILDGITAINEYAFENCTNLTSIIFPDSVTSMGEAIFYGCSNLTKITIPFVGKNKSNSLSSDDINYNTQLGWLFGKKAYEGSIEIKQWMHYADNYNICYFPATLTTVEITGGSLPKASFDNCSTLTHIILGNSVKAIGVWAFYGCSSLESIIIPNSVTNIGRYAFIYCSSLTSIIIPNSVITIGEYMFTYCNNLTIYAEATSKPSGWDEHWNDNNCPIIWGYNV